MEPSDTQTRVRPPRPPRPRKKSKAGLFVKLAVLAVPASCAIAFAIMGEERRDALLGLLPEGAGQRIMAVVFAFGLMAALAWVVLPLVHHATRWVWRGVWKLKESPARALLWPVRFVVYIGWLLMQCAFAVTAFLIVLSALVGLVFTIRVIQPDFLPTLVQGFGA